MSCYKIIQLERNPYKEDIFHYYFFPHKLVIMSKSMTKLKTFLFESQEAVEKKYASIEKTKLRIGYVEINRVETPKFYNLFNQEAKAFIAFYKQQKGVYFNVIYNRIVQDSEGDCFFNYRPLRIDDIEKHGIKNKALIEFLSTFRNLRFGAKINGNLFFHYRISFDLYNESIIHWDRLEPVDKLECALGKSVIKVIEKDAKFKHETSIGRIQFLSKGIFSCIDIETNKVYSIQDWDPDFNKCVEISDVDIHDSLYDYCVYLWNRIDADFGYSLNEAF